MKAFVLMVGFAVAAALTGGWGFWLAAGYCGLTAVVAAVKTDKV